MSYVSMSDWYVWIRVLKIPEILEKRETGIPVKIPTKDSIVPSILCMSDARRSEKIIFFLLEIFMIKKNLNSFKGPGFALATELVPTLAAKNVQCKFKGIYHHFLLN